MLNIMRLWRKIIANTDELSNGGQVHINFCLIWLSEFKEKYRKKDEKLMVMSGSVLPFSKATRKTITQK